MKQLLLLALGLSLAGTASAQTPVSTNVPTASITVDPSWSSVTADKGFNTPGMVSPQAEQIHLSYYTSTENFFPWQAPFQPNSAEPTFILLAYAQRFTLPTSTGILDSVKIRVQQVVANSPEGAVNIFIVTDSLFDFTGVPDAHLPLLGQAGILASASIPASAMTSLSNFDLRINTNHLEVPKEFFVYVTPSFGQTSNTSTVVLASEVKPDVQTTTENSRSVMDFLRNGTRSVGLMDNQFTIETDPIGVNFVIDAYAQVESSSVATPQTSAAAIFPNPVMSNGVLNIQHSEQINSVRIVNMLGNEMQAWNGKSTKVEISTSDLAAGVYNVIVSTEGGITSEKLIVR